MTRWYMENFQEVKIDEGENSFRFRIRDKDSFKPDSFRTKQLSEGVSLTLAIPNGEEDFEPQSYRFDKSRFKTADQVRKWLKDNDVVKLSEDVMKGQTIRGIELFAIGTHHEGTDQEITYTESDLDKIVENFDKLEDGKLKDGLNHHVPLVIGHEEPGEEGNLNDSSGIPASGWLVNLRRVGQKLIGDIQGVADVVAEHIETRRFRKVSVEIFDNFRGMGKVLKRIALLGGSLPEVKTLADIPIPHNERGSDSFSTFSMDIGDRSMAEENKPDVDGNAEHLGPETDAIMAELQKQADALKGFSERLAALEQKVNGESEEDAPEEDGADDNAEEPKPESTELAELRKENQALKDATNMSEVENELERLFQAGYVTKANKEEAKEQLEDAKALDVSNFSEEGSESRFEKIVKFIESQTKSVDYKETAIDSEKIEVDVDKFGDSTPESIDEHKAILAIGKKEEIPYPDAMRKFYETNKV